MVLTISKNESLSDLLRKNFDLHVIEIRSKDKSEINNLVIRTNERCYTTNSAYAEDLFIVPTTFLKILNENQLNYLELPKKYILKSD